ncbi:MAG: chorismate-binding protein [Sphingomonadales bacterium]|nr:chorismate-binding protein [Sphingomonadales bacterium]
MSAASSSFGRLENWDAAAAALADGRPALVWRRLIADTETPVGAAVKLIEPGRGDFLLESVEGGEVRGRYSLLGLDPDLVFRATGHYCEINLQWRSNREGFTPLAGDSLAELRTLVEACRIDVPPALPPALACVVGYFGYETIGLVEKLPRAPQSSLELPDMLFVRPTLILVFDRLSDALFCVAPVWASQTAPERALDQAQERIDTALHRLASAAPAPVLDATLPEPVLTPTMPAESYASMVRRAKDYIEAGDIFQVVLAQRFTCPFTLPPLALYRALRRVNPSPFLYFLDLPGFALIGSSIEILVRVRDGDVTIRPIAGTRPRGKTPEEDKANEASLLADPKERAEHLMLLDLGRNDVGRVAKAGTVKVTESYTIERYSHVMHIVSNRTGIIKDGVLHVQAGAGIVADSNPEYEQRECEAKAGALIAAAREAVRVAGEAGFGQ